MTNQSPAAEVRPSSGSDRRGLPLQAGGGALLRAMRPKQWLKNSLLLAAPLAAGVLDQGDVLVDLLFAVAAFCLVSSATYIFNDIWDREHDRSHPRKQLRPIAAGEISATGAAVFATLLAIAGFGLALAVRSEFAAVLGGYVALTTAYSAWLKHIALVDLIIVASGFVLRAVAGGVAVDVPISRWFLIVTSFSALFVVAGKRYGEKLKPEEFERQVAMRPVLAEYTLPFLRYVWVLASTVAVGAYCLWAFEQSGAGWRGAVYELTIVPFLLLMLRYGLLIERGRAEAPEDVVLGDRQFAAFTIIWALNFAAAIYVSR
jgi:decaprenyl-phosphate phosphoribosyltransferase